MSRVSVVKGLEFGVIGGLAGVVVMTLVMVAMFTMMGLPGDAFFAIIGIAMGVGVPAGLALHLVTGVLIGLIFGSLVSTVRVLQVTSTKKGVGLGLAAGGVAFFVLFLPMGMSLVPLAMIALLGSMQPGAPKEMIMQMAQSLMPALLGGGLVLHLIYGAVLGAVAGIGLKRDRVDEESQRGMAQIRSDAKSSGQSGVGLDRETGNHRCPACGGLFGSERELMEHSQKAHQPRVREQQSNQR